jgi:hypothetical protein
MLHYQFVQPLQRLMAVPSGSEAVRAFKKVLLVNAFKYPRDSPFQYLVFQRGYSQRTLFRLALRYIYAPCGYRFILSAFQPLPQSLQILLQSPAVFPPAYVVNSYRPIPVKAHVAIPQIFSIQQMS